jgi:hypothetical protein
MLRWTQWMRWHEISCATVMLGFVPDFSKTSMLALSKRLDALVSQGLVEKRKHGTARSARAEYRFLLTHDEPAIVVTVPSLDDAAEFLNN